MDSNGKLQSYTPAWRKVPSGDFYSWRLEFTVTDWMFFRDHLALSCFLGNCCPFSFKRWPGHHFCPHKLWKLIGFCATRWEGTPHILCSFAVPPEQSLPPYMAQLCTVGTLCGEKSWLVLQVAGLGHISQLWLDWTKDDPSSPAADSTVFAVSPQPPSSLKECPPACTHNHISGICLPWCSSWLRILNSLNPTFNYLVKLETWLAINSVSADGSPYRI